MIGGKNRKQKIKNINSTNFYYGIVIAFVAILIFLLLNMIAFQPLFSTIFPESARVIKSAQFTPSVDPTLADAISFDLMIIFNFVVLELLPIIIMALLLAFIMKYIKSSFLGFLTYLPVIIIFSIIFSILQVPPLINFAPEEYWITGQISFTTLFDFTFYTLRTAALNANLTGVLGALALPYLYTRYIFNIIIWTLMIFYGKKLFKSKNIPIDDKKVEKVIFSTIVDYISFNEYIPEQAQFLITKKKGVISEEIEQEREEIKTLLGVLEEDKLLEELKPEDENEKKRLYFTLRYLFSNKLIKIWKPEFKYVFERAEKQGLYIIYDDGRGVFDYAFRSDSLQDPGLVSGMFSAITSFVKEMTRSTDALKKIDHGDITILLEYGNKILEYIYHGSDIDHIVQFLTNLGYQIDIMLLSHDPIAQLNECKINHWQVMFYSQPDLLDKLLGHYSLFKDIDNSYIYYYDPIEENDQDDEPLKISIQDFSEQIGSEEKFGNTFIIIKGKIDDLKEK